MPETEAFTAEQLKDLAKLLERTVVPGNILTLAMSLLDERDAGEAKRHFNEKEFVHGVVVALHKAGRIPDAVAALRKGRNANSTLAYGLNEIMQGRALDNDKLEAFVNEYEPFFRAGEFRRRFTRVMRTVCAIGLGKGMNGLVGTGFLVGPDLVMTNYHVIKEYLRIVDGEVRENGDGTEIYCFFDYVAEPGPRWPLTNGDHPFLCVRALKEKWLVKARPPLPGDGMRESRPEDAAGKYDYAVIQLQKKVGNLPAERSGGGARGWLTLTDQVDTNTPNQRVIVYQHPEKTPQQFDIGDYKQLDESGTRVRYTVSTTKGSSGGPAIDSGGELFALHVAEVANPGPVAPKLNQGVVIDLIAKDLQGAPGWNPQPPPEEQPMSFWSLTDDLKNPQPIIGRGNFRDHIYEMSTQPKPRVMVVWGPAGSGVRYSVKLLERIVGAQTPVIPFSQKDLSTKTPRELVRSMLGQLAIIGMTVPENLTESPSRGIRDLARWLAEKLAEDEAKKRIAYPAWLVLNTVVPPGQRFEWAEHIDELIATIAGVGLADQEEIDVPQLRLLILTSAPASLPLSGIARFDEDLATDTDYLGGFVQCLERAQHALDKSQEFGGNVLWEGLARREMTKDPNTPPRRVLSDLARDIVVNAS